MAVAAIARTLQKRLPHLLLSSVLNAPTRQHVSSSTQLAHHLSRSLHQTLPLPFRFSPENPRTDGTEASRNYNPYKVIDFVQHVNENHGQRKSEVHKFSEFIKNVHAFPSDGEEAMALLDEFGVRPDESLVYSAIWGFRQDWKLSFLLFKWGEKWSCNGVDNWSLIIWVLGNHKKFNTAWCLIRDLHRSSLETRQAMLVMIDRYAAANDPGKAIEAFQMMEKFSLTPDKEAYYKLLSALCENGNVEEAEDFMVLNKKLFPLEAESFNIILSGWCNTSLDVFEAKRIWREMAKCCILPNGTTYTHMISCFSKVGDFFDSLRLYDEMKKRGFVPGIEVYNSLIHVLTHCNCLKEALRIVEKIKELGMQPNSVTYNSMIRPLCEAAKLEEARNILATMLENDVSPTIETYHSFIECASLEVTLKLLNHMRKAGLGPTTMTFRSILCNFFKIKQPEYASKIWVEMKQYELVPDSTLYSVMIEGLARCGILNKARELYAEMISNGVADDPKLKKLLKVPRQDGGHRQGGHGQMKSVKHTKKPRQNMGK